MGRPDMSDYVDVAERLRELRAAHPEGCVRPANPAEPYRIETVGDRTFVVVVAACYRTPDDPMPGIGMAWEPFPGPTQFTRDSELQNAETSAWGRAIVATLVADTKRVASREEVEARQPAPPADPGKVRHVESLYDQLPDGVTDVPRDKVLANARVSDARADDAIGWLEGLLAQVDAAQEEVPA